MTRLVYLIVFFIIAAGVQPVFSRPLHDAPAPPAPVAAISPAAVSTSADTAISGNLTENQYLLESQRLVQVAMETFRLSDYTSAHTLAQDAMHYARLSDIHVAIAVAQSRIAWAISSGISRQYPVEFGTVHNWFNTSINAWNGEDWDTANTAAHMVIELIAYFEESDGPPPLALFQQPPEVRSPGAGSPGAPSSPATYTVRPWAVSRDSFWTIAALVYGDPFQWRVLYDANRDKLPDPNNPDWLVPGMIVDIPSIHGEIRQGEWRE